MVVISENLQDCQTLKTEGCRYKEVGQRWILGEKMAIFARGRTVGCLYYPRLLYATMLFMEGMMKLRIAPP